MATHAEASEIRRKGRQRLIGAITIVLLLVVFVPMVLDPEPRKDAKDAVQAIPPKEGAAPLPSPVPAASPAPASAPAASASPAPAPAPAATAAAEPAKLTPGKAEPAAPPPPGPAPAAGAPTTPAPPRLEGFAIQVGAFGDEDKLKQARDKLAAARIAHFIERLPKGLTRLRAGPYKTREEAEKAIGAVKSAGLDGKLVSLP